MICDMAHQYQIPILDIYLAMCHFDTDFIQIKDNLYIVYNFPLMCQPQQFAQLMKNNIFMQWNHVIGDLLIAQ